MKKYLNNARGLQTVHMNDGSAKFLKRGQSIELDESLVSRTDKGIKVSEVTQTVIKSTKPVSIEKNLDE